MQADMPQYLRVDTGDARTGDKTRVHNGINIIYLIYPIYPINNIHKKRYLYATKKDN